MDWWIDNKYINNKKTKKKTTKEWVKEKIIKKKKTSYFSQTYFCFSNLNTQIPIITRDKSDTGLRESTDNLTNVIHSDG